MSKTEFISPKASPVARKFIVAARAILYSVQMTSAIKQMMTGADSLEKSAAPFIATLVMKLQAKMGPLSPQDLPMVVYHICGSVADLAKELGDPAAKDTHKLCARLMMAVKAILDGQHPGQPPQASAPPGSPPGPGQPSPPPAAAPPMQQLAG